MENLQPLDAFSDVEKSQDQQDKSLIMTSPQSIANLNTFAVGFGSKVLRVDQQGLWLGGPSFKGAPFSVDMLGNLIANSAKITGNFTLGGQNNQNGILSILNALGQEVVHMDNLGIEIFNGNILIKNKNGQTILDTTGIVSTANFLNNQLVDLTTHTTTSTSFVPVPGSTFNTFHLSRQSRVILTLTGIGFNANFPADGSNMQLGFNDNIQGDLFDFSIDAAWYIDHIDPTVNPANIFINVGNEIKSLSLIANLLPGDHNLNIIFKVNGTGTATLHGYIATYVVLGT